MEDIAALIEANERLRKGVGHTRSGRKFMTHAIDLESTSRFNEMKIIYSLENPVERGIVETYISDVKRVCTANKCPFDAVFVDSRGAFQHELQKLFERARDAHTIPILQLIMHGSKTLGVKVGKDIMPWDRLLPLLRKINIKGLNSLIVITSVCFSMQLALEASITLPAPFYMLIAPAQKIRFAQFIPQTIAFLSAVFEEHDAVKSYDKTLRSSSQLYHCQVVLLQGLTRYLRQSVFGRAGEKRINKIVQEINFRHGGNLDAATLNNLRRAMGEHVGDVEHLIKRYEEGYLYGRAAGFSAEQLIAFALGPQAQEVSNETDETRS